MDFNIENILATAEPVLAVRQVTTVDTTALVSVLRQLGQKIEEQGAQINVMQSEISALKRENMLFRSNAEEYNRLKGDVAGLIEDVESLTMYAKLPKIPNRARDGMLRSYLTNDAPNLARSVSEPVPYYPDDSRTGLPHQQRSIVVATQMSPSSAGIPPASSVNSAVRPAMGSANTTFPGATGQGRPRTGLTMEADPEANGLRVTDVKANSSADEAGIRPDDIIISADGHATYTSSDFVAVLETKRVGEILQIQFVRDNVSRLTGLKLKGKQSAYSEDV